MKDREIEEYLNHFYKGTKNPSLNAMQYFMNEYNHFEKEMKWIHIAGTNGKGSCTEIISNILSKQGYKVGKFLSPHLIRYNERISINGKEISDEEMAELIKELQHKIEKYNQKNKVNITLFELETIMALLYFYRNNVDFAVLETGLGGLYDCTNIISHPLVSVITSIGYDHMRILGNTLTEIAYQKAGIIKENSHTVVFEQSEEMNQVFIQECQKKNNHLHIVTEKEISHYHFDPDFQYFSYKNMNHLALPLKGKIQIHNASLCIEVMNILNELVIFDGAHNEPAIRNLQDMVKMYYHHFKRVYIISILQRKDYKKMIELLAEDKEAIFVLTSGNHADKYVSSETLYSIAIHSKEKEKIYIKTLEEAIEDAMNGDENVVNFVVGSFYAYKTVLSKIKSKQ